jgi:exonuclease III
MNPSSILIWNARGLNSKARRDVVRYVILSSQAEIVCIQETKVANMNQPLFLSVFGSAFDKFVDLPAQGTRGGVLIAWKSSICQEIATRVDRFSVSNSLFILRNRKAGIGGLQGFMVHKLRKKRLRFYRN